MPGYAGALTDGKFIDVPSRSNSTWPEKVRQRHDAINRRRK